MFMKNFIPFSPTTNCWSTGSAIYDGKYETKKMTHSHLTMIIIMSMCKRKICSTIKTVNTDLNTINEYFINLQVYFLTLNI